MVGTRKLNPHAVLPYLGDTDEGSEAGVVSRPATVTSRPSGSVVTVGYQRPRAILGNPGTQDSLAGSKILVTSRPLSSALCPPDTMKRPSAMNAWPAQKSIVSFRMVMAVVGGPRPGSQSRGFPMPPSFSACPTQGFFRSGNRCMCKGTMSQSTGGSHLPTVASTGSGAIRMLPELAMAPFAFPPAAKLRA